MNMAISSFRDKKTKQLESGSNVREFKAIEKVARRKLRMIQAATKLSDLKAPPGNRLEALRGDRSGQHSIRVNDQWRICFVWENDRAYDVEIVDYH